MLVIQIPCLNEEESLPRLLATLPRAMVGFSKVLWLVIDDGSVDRTGEIAQSLGVDHIVRFQKNRGLAAAFIAGLDAAVSLGADVIVNTDADGQYESADIPLLVQPILDGRADIVIGARPIAAMKQFSPIKRCLQKLGSMVVRRVSRTDVPDAPSGFRAFTRDAAMRLNVFSSYTYTLETIIQAGQKGMAIQTVPVRVSGETRPSRLVRSSLGYVFRSLLTIIRIFAVYQPFKFFMRIGLVSLALGLLVGARFLWYYFSEGSAGHVQSLILASILIGMGFQTMLIAFIADLQAANRVLLEEIRYRQKLGQSK